jgi:hypothetical protein
MIDKKLFMKFLAKNGACKRGIDLFRKVSRKHPDATVEELIAKFRSSPDDRSDFIWLVFCVSDLSARAGRFNTVDFDNRLLKMNHERFCKQVEKVLHLTYDSVGM